MGREELRSTLVADGTSDRMLIPILERALREAVPEGTVLGRPVMADFSRYREKPTSLQERLATAIRDFPCELLFIHRDAEREPPENRRREIDEAVTAAASIDRMSGTVPVVPVRMSEAWLLLDEYAIRRAANNPNGKTPLSLPTATNVESVSDPKDALHQLLKDASELQGRRRKQFQPHRAAVRVADFIDSLDELRDVPAFRRLEEDLLSAVRGLGV